MARICTVCNHSSANEINNRLARCDSIAGIARDFAVGEDALRRHADKHLPKDLIAAPSIDEITNADNLLSQIEKYKTEIWEMKAEARADGNIELALKAVDRALKCIELQSKVRGLIQEQSVNVNLQQVNIYSSPEWLAVGYVLNETLAGYPELRSEVATRLLVLQEGHV